jgi:hypothetical protein
VPNTRWPYARWPYQRGYSTRNYHVTGEHEREAKAALRNKKPGRLGLIVLRVFGIKEPRR